MTAILIFTRVLHTIIAFKLLTWKKKISIKEILYLVGMSIFITSYLTMTHYYTSLRHPIRVVLVDINILMMLSILAYRKGYSFKKSVILPLCALILTTTSEILVILGTRAEGINLTIVLLTTLLTPFVSFSVAHFTRGIRYRINQLEKIQASLLYSLIFLFVLSHIMIAFQRHLFSDCRMFFHIITLYFAIISTVLSLIFFFYAKIIESNYQLQKKQDEHEIMQYYTNEIEKQYTDVRKLMHDYQNILLSINAYIEEDDLSGLKKYFYGRVKTVSKKIIKQDFMLENLSRIKVREIKSILAVKLIMAHEKGLNISFEAREDINVIPMNTITLVRMLGIVLDNAIEALIELGEGLLQIGVWNDEERVMFVIQNPCCSELPKLHELERIGFSTKGKNRGLGLNNLSELAEEEANVLLQTVITNNQFIQKIIIMGESLC